MPPSRRARAKKNEKQLDKISEFLKAHGHDVAAVDNAVKEIPLTAEEKSLQAEATLLHLANPSMFISKKCKRCEQVFATSYTYVSYCSDSCRATAIQTQTGIAWDPRTDRWANLRAQAPLVIKPEVYSQLVEFAKAVLSQNQIEIEGSQEVQYQTMYLPRELVSHLFDDLDNESVHLPFYEQHTNPEIEPLESEHPLNGVTSVEEDPFGF